MTFYSSLTDQVGRDASLGPPRVPLLPGAKPVDENTAPVRPLALWTPLKPLSPAGGVENASGSLSKFVDAANDVQSTGFILEDGSAPG